ncbi:hypothetical protein KY320_02490 [Candidatus Woesearchaeota archaeon]|nr:hypothetical protein [Candidatus Woesearchaeota archaeon]
MDRMTQTMKRGLLFTVTTFLLLSSVFFLSFAYVRRSAYTQSALHMTKTGDRLRYLEDDIGSSAFIDLLGMDIPSVRRRSQNLTLTFTEITLSKDSNYDAMLQQYQSFIENNYASQNNANITLQDFDTKFTIQPYNTTFIVDTTNLEMGHFNSTQVERISVVIKLNQSADDLLSNTTPTDGIGKLVEVSVDCLDRSNKPLLTDTFALLETDKHNQKFEMRFAADKSLTVYFGESDDIADRAVLEVSINGTDANITSLSIVYPTQLTPTTIDAASVSILIPHLNIRKNSKIYLFAE